MLWAKNQPKTANMEKIPSLMEKEAYAFVFDDNDIKALSTAIAAELQGLTGKQNAIVERDNAISPTLCGTVFYVPAKVKSGKEQCKR